METIFDFVKEQRTQYRAYTIEIADGYDYSQYQTLRTIELYHNSKFTTGNLDSLKREKPFYNITKFRVNVETRATDIDTKDIQVSSEASDGYVQSFWSKGSSAMATSSTTGRAGPRSISPASSRISRRFFQRYSSSSHHQRHRRVERRVRRENPTARRADMGTA
jgi:hypothetical protein